MKGKTKSKPTKKTVKRKLVQAKSFNDSEGYQCTIAKKVLEQSQDQNKEAFKKTKTQIILPKPSIKNISTKRVTMGPYGAQEQDSST